LKNPELDNARYLGPLLVLALLAGLSGSVLAQTVALPAPQNSHANSYGGGWECDYGFRKAAGACAAIELPANAHSDSNFGRGWDCNRGYHETAGACAAIKIPADAHLDSNFGRGWDCNRGYDEAGGTCVAVRVPTDARST
jgi:hypothetical protein